MNVIDLSVLSQRNEALTSENRELKAWLDAETAWHHAEQAELKAAGTMLEAASAHATICNLKNQELRCRLAEKTGTRKK